MLSNRQRIMLETLKAEIEYKEKQQSAGKVELLKATSPMASVEPHAARLEAAADAMEKAGIGGHMHRGHVHVLRRMAGCMRADAAMGKVPHSFEDMGFVATSAAASAVSAHLMQCKCVDGQCSCKPM